MRERKSNTLYLECNSGISGDMMVAALLDLGADREVLKKALKSIPVHGFKIRISRVKKAGLDVCDFHVILDEEHENHDHDMEYLFGGGEHGHSHEEEGHGDHVCREEVHRHENGNHEHSGHHHGHGAVSHSHDGHHHEHRGLREILHIIRQTEMSDGAKERAENIFRILAGAEAKAHGVPEQEVHFHEVGAVDSIVDVISAAVCLDDLGITECIVTELCEGTGTIRCQHGVMSVPVPAVLNIVQEHQLKLSVTDIRGELVTPTGAAIAAAVRTKEDLPGHFRIIKTGMGGGKREYERPSILRAMLIEEADETADRGKETKKSRNNKTDTVNLSDSSVGYAADRDDRDVKDNMDVIYKLETNIDDCSGEVLGYVMDRLFEAGARDVHYIPVYMKKNRPAYQLNVICREDHIAALENIIFSETTTIGIRRQKMERSVLPRRNEEIMTGLGAAEVKECRLPEGGGVRYYPEYAGVIKLCQLSKKPFREVYRLIEEACRADRRDRPEVISKGSRRGHRFRKKV